MKNSIIFLLLISFVSCIGQDKQEKLLTVSVSNDEPKKNTRNIPKEDSFQMNMGFDDTPVWVWAKYDHNLNSANIKYDHIYGINYWDEEGGIKTLYYERDRGHNKRDSINFSDYILKPYPGDRTLQLIGKKGDTILLFNVLENKSLSSNLKGKEYQRIPTINTNTKNEKVSDYDVRINYVLKEKPFYEVTIINDAGINVFTFKSNCILMDDLTISYYDLTSNRIYLLEQDCYLEKTDL